MDTDSFRFLRHYLYENETVLWKGKPGTGHLLAFCDFVLIPAGLLVLFVSVYTALDFFAAGETVKALLIGVGVSAVGLCLAFGRLPLAYLQRKRTVYAVTDQRILWCRGSDVKTLLIEYLPETKLTVYQNGTGSISFGDAATTARVGIRRARVRYAVTENPDFIRFEDISEPEKVHKIILGAVRESCK